MDTRGTIEPHVVHWLCARFCRAPGQLAQHVTSLSVKLWRHTGQLLGNANPCVGRGASSSAVAEFSGPTSLLVPLYGAAKLKCYTYAVLAGVSRSSHHDVSTSL
mmetsp:Transcript_3833/g.11428  ORF Transcript_3833/g.11428 Transcript_3833/m.11428 type:complete len:104 (-) Transcript_3833:1001-1312(-)